MEKKMSRPTQKIICHNCGKEFDRECRYVKAAEKKGRKHFCSRSCATTDRNKSNNYKYNNLLPQCKKGYRQARYTPFTWYIARARSRGKNNGLTSEILENLWNKQKGLCAISNISLILHDECKDNRYLASLDRIDSSLPYQEDNIQFIALPLNLAKQAFDNKEFISFLKEVSANL
jgi:hypothetical protein